MSNIFGNFLGFLGSDQAASGYQISRSLRFNSSDSAYLSRTPASAGNRKTWTWAGWVKRSKFGSDTWVLRANSGGTDFFLLGFGSGNQFYLTYTAGVGGAGENYTSAVFRDPSAWYHLVCAFDSTQATASNRIKLYVNGVEQALAVSSPPTLNADYQVNTTNEHRIGGFSGSYADFYLADVHFIDGQALTPSSFTEVDATTGQLVPIAYSGTYGTNGFHLPFSDNSTAAALGTDTSGNGNDWTVNNISVAVGTGRYVGATTGSLFSGAWINVFNGLISPVDSTNWAYTYNTTTSLTLLESLTGIVEVYATRPGSSNSGTHTITLSTGSSVTLTTNSSPQWYSFGSQTNVTSITVVAGDPGIAILAIRVNGVILIDAQFAGGNDSLVDTPTNYGTDTGAGGEVRGNYCTLNAAGPGASALSEGNLRLNTNSNAVLGTIGVTNGKWYYEGLLQTQINDQQMFGVVNQNYTESTGQIGNSAYGWAILVQSNVSNGQPFHNGVTGASLTTFASGDIVQVAFDVDSGKIWFGRNGTWLGSGDPAAGTNPIFSNLSGTLKPGITNRSTSGGVLQVNFGQRPFAFTVPSGFKALCDTNLPAPVVAKPNTVMDVLLWTGNGSARSITGLNFNPDFVWIKGRSGATDHALYDVVRGTEKRLESNNTDAEVTSDGGVTAFNSDGFSLGTLAQVNTNSSTYVAWAWDAGSSTVTNTDGSITSQVRANASAGFSIVTYTGNGSSGSTVGHGLGVAPGFIIFKERSQSTGGWIVYHSSIGATGAVYLNLTSAVVTSSNYFNNTAPTSTVFTLGGSGEFNDNGQTNIAYCFAPVAGYSAFGSYTGNGSTDGPFVFCGFRPRWLLVKGSDVIGGQWFIVDASRSPYNVTANYLQAESSSAEGTTSALWDFCSNGFKLRGAGAGINGSGSTYIYAAFAESPFQYARAR